MSDFLTGQRADWRGKNLTCFNISNVWWRWKSTAEVNSFHLHENLLSLPNKEEFLHITVFQKHTKVITITNVACFRSYFRHPKLKKQIENKKAQQLSSLQTNPLESAFTWFVITFKFSTMKKPLRTCISYYLAPYTFLNTLSEDKEETKLLHQFPVISEKQWILLSEVSAEASVTL